MMIKQAESLQARRVKAVKAAALVVLFVLVSFAPWSKTISATRCQATNCRSPGERRVAVHGLHCRTGSRQLTG